MRRIIIAVYVLVDIYTLFIQIPETSARGPCAHLVVSHPPANADGGGRRLFLCAGKLFFSYLQQLYRYIKFIPSRSYSIRVPPTRRFTTRRLYSPDRIYYTSIIIITIIIIISFTAALFRGGNAFRPRTTAIFLQKSTAGDPEPPGLGT